MIFKLDEVGLVAQQRRCYIKMLMESGTTIFHASTSLRKVTNAACPTVVKPKRAASCELRAAILSGGGGVSERQC